MKPFSHKLYTFIGLAFLSGCTAMPEIVSLPEQIHGKIKSTDVYLEQCEKKMHADIKKSNLSTYTGGGMLIAFVDIAIETHRQERAEEAMIDIHKQIQSFDFERKLRTALADIVSQSDWLHVKNINDIEKLKPETLQKVMQTGSADTILITQFHYKLNPDFKVLTGTLYVTMFAKSNNIRNLLRIEEPLNQPILKFHVSATQALKNPTDDIEENAKMWSQGNGLFLQKALDNIIQRVLFDLKKVLKNPSHLPDNED